MKNNHYLKLLVSFFALIFLISCSESETSDEEEITPPPIPQINTLYTTMQWESSSPSEEDMDSDLLEAAFSNGLADGSFTQSELV